ncbi:hypothetical protein [Psychrobacter sp.]|uniref:hypothetical protein n=1 Tax=Psychrobacter sp. TaxID=56811 RepID=UPI003F9CE99D
MGRAQQGSHQSSKRAKDGQTFAKLLLLIFELSIFEPFCRVSTTDGYYSYFDKINEINAIAGTDISGTIALV